MMMYHHEHDDNEAAAAVAEDVKAVMEAHPNESVPLLAAAVRTPRLLPIQGPRTQERG